MGSREFLGIFSSKALPKPANSRALLSPTHVVKCVAVSMFSSFYWDILHMVKASLGKVPEVKEGSKVKAVHVALVTLLLHFKIPTFNKLTFNKLKLNNLLA